MSQVIMPAELTQLLKSGAARPGRVVADGSTRFDDGTIFLPRDLEFIETAVMETEFRTLNGELLVPSDTSVPDWYNTIVGRTSRTGGVPEWVQTGSTQVPMVDEDLTEEIWNQQTMAIGASWSARELAASQNLGRPLDASSAVAAAQACLTLMDNVKFSGDLSVGLKGFFDTAAVPRSEADVGINENFTPLQILDFLNDLIDSVADSTSDVEAPNRLSLSSRAYRYIARTPMAVDNSISIMDQLVMNSTFITSRDQIQRMSQLNSVTSGGIAYNEIAVAHNFDPQKNRCNITPPAPYGSIMQVGLRFLQIWTATVSEVQHRKPLASAFRFNTNRTS